MTQFRYANFDIRLTDPAEVVCWKTPGYATDLNLYVKSIDFIK